MLSEETAVFHIDCFLFVASFATMSSKASATSANAILSAKYQALELPAGKTFVTYVWNDGRVDNTRAKSRVLDFVPQDLKQVPTGGYGKPGKDENGADYAIDVFLKPIAMYKDPFRGGDHKLVLCEEVDADGKALEHNTRAACVQAMDQVMSKHEPWFGIEQEYVLMESTLGSDSSGSRPLGWPIYGEPVNVHYDFIYGVGSNIVIGRPVHEAFLRACVYAGIDIFGENSECMPAQWEFQVGPLPGVKCGDDLVVARHILYRVAEDFNVSVSLDPKVIPGMEWPGTGVHVNYSTTQSRDKSTGMQAITDMVHKLSLKNAEHMSVYARNQGKDNERRLIGGITNCSMDTFTSGVGDRTASVRIPRSVAADGCGYMEDRRPASNCDPYLVMERIVRTTLIPE